MKRSIRWLIPLVLAFFAVSSAMAAITISTASKEVGKEGGAFSVSTGGSGTWTATSKASWITLNRASGNAGVSCIYVVSANFSTDSRTGTIDISGNTFTVYQTGYEATLSPTSATTDASGGSGTIQVTADAGVSWTAKANVSWLSVTPSSGASVGSVTYKVAAYTNGATPRTGTLTVAGKTFNVTQSGRDVVLTPTTVSVGPDVATFSVTVAALASTKWTVTPVASWLSVVDSGHGYGNDTIMVAAGANPSVLSRKGIVWIGSQKVTVTQAGTTNYSLSITPTNATASPVGAYGNVAVYSTPDAAWGAESWASWITISDGATGAGNGNTKYVVSANPSLTTRTGRVAFKQLLGETNTATGAAVLRAIPKNMTARHFAFGDSTLSWVGNAAKTTSATTSAFGLSRPGWTVFTGGCDICQKAMKSDGTGTVVINDVNLVFPGSCVTNNGKPLTNTVSNYSYTDADIWGVHAEPVHYYPYPITSTGPFSATYNFWIRLDSFPATNAFIFERIRTDGREKDAGGRYTNLWYKNNGSFGLNVDNMGVIRVERHGTYTPFSGKTLQSGRWTMLTLVGKDQNSITVYLDGEEIGNVATTLSFGYFPPTDCRYYYKPSLHSTPASIEGSVVPTVQKLTVGGWNGAIDEMTLIDDAMTSAQVKALYEATRPKEIIHTVTQGVIEPSVEPTWASFPASGGSGSVRVTVAGNTQWTAKSGASWISLVGLTNHVGSTTVSYTVAPNPGTEKRSAKLTLADKTVTVSQAGLWSEVTYDGTVFGETSGSGFIDVQVEGDGTWTAKSDSAWLTLLDTSGHGSGSVMFVVDDFNTAVASRTATVTIAGKTVKITQRGFSLSIDPVVGEVGSNAGAGEIGISAPIDAVWEAIVTTDWITLVGGNMGVGNGTLRYTVADNTTGETRTGKIIISGQEYTVTQHPYLTLTTKVDGSGSVAGAGDYETNERVTLRAVPAEGFAFTHWSGDAVGVEPQVTITMDMAKTVTAHFIPEDAVQRLAEEKAAQGGFYTREQLKALAMGDTVIEVDGESGTVDLALQLLETADLVGGQWDGADVPEGNGSVTVDAEGKVHVRVAPKGNTAFYRLVNVTEGEE